VHVHFDGHIQELQGHDLKNRGGRKRKGQMNPQAKVRENSTMKSQLTSTSVIHQKKNQLMLSSKAPAAIEMNKKIDQGIKNQRCQGYKDLRLTWLQYFPFKRKLLNQK
jgi:hypothetical protein